MSDDIRYEWIVCEECQEEFYHYFLSTPKMIEGDGPYCYECYRDLCEEYEKKNEYY